MYLTFDAVNSPRGALTAVRARLQHFSRKGGGKHDPGSLVPDMNTYDP
jgi:hypothetical protein